MLRELVPGGTNSKWKYEQFAFVYLRGSESCPSRGLLFGLFARGHPDRLRCEE